MINKYKLAIYALHPIMYQVPIFKELNKVLNNGNLNTKSVVLFGDDLSLKNTFSKAFQTSFSYGPWLLEGYNHKFLKNYGF